MPPFVLPIKAWIFVCCRQVMDANPTQLTEFRSGKAKLLGYFQGQCMKASQGRVNPALLNKLLPKMLSGEIS